MSQVVLTTEQTARVNFLQRKIDETYQDLEEQDRFKKDKINRLAGYYKEQVALGELKIELKDIAKLILKEIDSRGIDIGKSTVYSSIPDDCKDEYEERLSLEQEEDSNVGMPNLKYDIEKLGRSDNLKVDEAHTALAERKKALQAEARLITDQLEQVEKLGTERKLTFSTHQKNESKSTPKPGSRVTKMVQAFVFGAELFTKLAEKAEEFPSDAKEEEYHAASVYQLLSIFSPMVDEKHSNDLVSPEGWLQIQKYNTIHGKHAAAVKFGIRTPSGEYRPLTREQVGDTFEEIVDKTTELYNAIPGVLGISDWYNKRVRPYIGERKINLSGDLSEKA